MIAGAETVGAPPPLGVAAGPELALPPAPPPAEPEPQLVAYAARNTDMETKTMVKPLRFFKVL